MKTFLIIFILAASVCCFSLSLRHSTQYKLLYTALLMQLSLAEIYMDEAEQLNKDSLSVLIQTSIDSLVIPELRSMLPDVRNRH